MEVCIREEVDEEEASKVSISGDLLGRGGSRNSINAKMVDRATHSVNFYSSCQYYYFYFYHLVEWGAEGLLVGLEVDTTAAIYHTLL
jgi:hypothetical protein